MGKHRKREKTVGLWGNILRTGMLNLLSILKHSRKIECSLYPSKALRVPVAALSVSFLKPESSSCAIQTDDRSKLSITSRNPEISRYREDSRPKFDAHYWLWEGQENSTAQWFLEVLV